MNPEMPHPAAAVNRRGYHVRVEPDPEPGAEAAWDAEITQRIARFDSEEAEPVPAAEVFDRLRQIAPGP
jgi:hypothetical protein